GLAPKPLNRMILLVLAMLLVFLLALLSVSVYLALDRSSNKVEYSDFYSIVKQAGNVTLLIEAGNADDAQLAIMENCSTAMAAELAKSKVTSKTYILRGSNCSAYFPPGANATGLLEVPNCVDKITTPLVFFNSSLVTSSTYSGLLLKQAYFAGSSDYYSICAPAEALKLYTSP
ncbi:MAG: hypothetical protein PHS02_02570, partial [Candidatus ainarchaeum sp.]|nr:hypothetical protein [Candidatus ainarchaeum sp.]